MFIIISSSRPRILHPVQQGWQHTIYIIQGLGWLIIKTMCTRFKTMKVGLYYNPNISPISWLCYVSRHCHSDLEKGVDPGNLVPREKLMVVDLHANFQQNSRTFVEYQSHLAWYCTFKKFAVYDHIRISSTEHNLVFLTGL